ncbi:unnamed protein product [Paramecium octaurelia]|uniref:Amino acid transporter transmembrane domain-containing protein n=1 Tax=Paramecium octaurelia TaxID=43137 RepID=A0A8S1XRD6_PAROT|nr:unnamed protein product [Paramecium octaurelia]
MKQQNFIKPFPAFNTFINVLMASGPILLPMSSAKVGYGYASISLSICCLISIIACDFIVEALYLADQIDKETDMMSRLNIQATHTVSDSTEEISSSQPLESKYAIQSQFEYGSMAKLFYGKWAEYFTVSIIVIYLYGAVVAKGVMVGNSLSSVFKGITLVEEYWFWIVIFFVLCGILSFKDVASIQIVQTIVALARYLTILAMLTGSIQQMAAAEEIQEMQWFNIDALPQMISTAIFAFLMHHSSPGMLRPVRPTSAIRKIIFISFIFGLLTFLFVCLTAIWAFPFKDLAAASFYNQLFNQGNLKWAYYIISFYMFLNIAALPVLTITIRKNLMKLVVPHLVPKDSLKITLPSAIFTLLIVVPCASLAVLLKDNIEIIVGLTGGVCGVFILLTIPAALVLQGRKKHAVKYEDNPYISKFQHPFWIWALIVLGCVFVPYNLYMQIKKIIDHYG